MRFQGGGKPVQLNGAELPVMAQSSVKASAFWVALTRADIEFNREQSYKRICARSSALLRRESDADHESNRAQTINL
jgi:hypothetical protein